jgi:hypothetical protein
VKEADWDWECERGGSGGWAGSRREEMEWVAPRKGDGWVMPSG